MKTIAFDLHGTLAQVEDKSILIADIEYLKELKKHYTLALVSGCSRIEADKTLEETGLGALFDADKIVLCEEAGGDKDTGIPFEELKRRIVGPIVMIGDQPADASGSTLVGIPSVLVEHMPSNIEQSKALIRAIEAAIEILESE